MSYIEIKNIKTYPKEFIEYCFEYKEDIISFININSEQLKLENTYFKEMKCILDNYDILALHASRLYRKENILENGIVIPSQNNNLTYYIMDPLKKFIDNKLYIQIYTKMEEKIKQYEAIHFIIGSEEDVCIENNFFMLEHYGGEFLEDVCDILEINGEVREKIAKFGKKYIIKFKHSFSKIDEYDSVGIIINMCKNVLKLQDGDGWNEMFTNDNIDSSEIINIKEI